MPVAKHAAALLRGGVAKVPLCGPDLVGLACMSLTKCWTHLQSWAGMHFTCRMLEPLTKLLTVAYVIGIIDKHHPPPGGVEVSRITLPAHGLVWLGSTRMAVGPAAAGDPSFVWQHVDAVLNAATPSLEE